MLPREDTSRQNSVLPEPSGQEGNRRRTSAQHECLTLAKIELHEAELEELDVEGVLAFAERLLTNSPAGSLSAASRAALATSDLHFRDLRREAGSRWLEGGVPLHAIRDWLGYTSIAQTSTYLAGTMKTKHDAMRQFEERRAALQPFATDVRTGGQRQSQSDTKRLSCKLPSHGGVAGSSPAAPTI